ncbi:MAG: 1-deoxy-D-xylulose-5-phosphate reductoisomerase [Planctomycetota bacterium]
MRAGADRPTRLIVLGSTGSIGTQTLDVVRHHNALGGQPRFEVVGIAAGRASDTLSEQAREFRCPPVSAETDGPTAAADLIRATHADGGIDLVMASIVGIAGLDPVLAALQLGIDVALANKETLVAAGELVVSTARAHGASLLPVDSEHSALWQCLAGAQHTPARPPLEAPAGVARMTLTASGGALRDATSDAIAAATPEHALAHPTWSMGPKVTVDCATLLNKGFEAIEARWLFGMPPERLGVLIHPTSTVHSLVEFDDGAVLAQLGTPDMRTAIQYALLGGVHAPALSSDRLDLAKLGTLEFREPDADRFPMLGLAFEAMRRGGTAGAILNAANETAVAAFLDPANADGSRLRLGRVTEVVAEAFGSVQPEPAESLDAIKKADAEARAFTSRII